jgi:hypothetical protein
MKKYLFVIFCLIAARASAQDMEKYDAKVAVAVPDEGSPSEKTLSKIIQFSPNDSDKEPEKTPKGTLAVYIDIEEAFNQNPWTLQAKRDIKLNLEAKQIEFARLKDQLSQLKAKRQNIIEEINFYSPFYAVGKRVSDFGGFYPKTAPDNLSPILDSLTYGAVANATLSPENTPEKMKSLKLQAGDVARQIIEKEIFILNYKELSREEALSKQDIIIQKILKEIYSGVKEYSSLRNISLVVDKKDLVYGTPLNVTAEFVKWMKGYHKKYVKQNGDII